MENKHKHLEFIQAVIARVSRSSFFIKGWSITLVTVTLLLLTKDGEHGPVIAYSIFPLVYFWILDGYLYSRETFFRSLYDDVRKLNEEDINFSMDPNEEGESTSEKEKSGYYQGRFRYLYRSMMRPSILLFHAPLLMFYYLILVFLL